MYLCASVYGWMDGWMDMVASVGAFEYECMLKYIEMSCFAQPFFFSTRNFADGCTCGQMAQLEAVQGLYTQTPNGNVQLTAKGIRYIHTLIHVRAFSTSSHVKHQN